MIKQTQIRRTLNAPILAIAVVMLASCASKTSYAPQSSDVTQGVNGYTSQQIAPNRYRVTFSGNEFTSRQRVEEYLLYRAAELTQEQGFDGFNVVRDTTNYSVETDIETVPTVGVIEAYPAFSPYYNFYGPTFGAYVYDPHAGRPFVNERVIVEQAARYDASAVIEMFKGDIANSDTQSFNASQVMSRIGPVQEPDM